MPQNDVSKDGVSTDSFYQELPTFSNFTEITDFEKYVSVPEDWYIIITDICNSTRAIESGNYKEVNMLGACSITALLNIAGNLEIPFVFGGDGATILIPPSLYTQAVAVLPSIQDLASSQFDLEMRIGIVPVAHVLVDNLELKVAKLHVSEHYDQAVFSGGGINYAEHLIKAAQTAEQYKIPATHSIGANLSGLECRWQDIPTPDEEVISLLVLAMAWDEQKKHQIYQSVVEQIQAIYGDIDTLNPVAKTKLRLTFNAYKLMPEVKARAKTGTWYDRLLYGIRIAVENLLGMLFMTFKIRIGRADWGRYPQDVLESIDYKKFDDMLRLVIPGSVIKREQLLAYLEACYRQGELTYGWHTSNRALMTCLVFERNGRQIHFVDGADGGYAAAAKAMKQRTYQRSANLLAYSRIAKLRKAPDLQNDLEQE